MAGMRLTLVGADEVRQRLINAPQAATRSMRDAMQKSLNIVYRRIQDNLTGRVLNVKTGHLRQTIDTVVEDGGLRGRIGSNVEYASIHEFGGVTPPHRIEARRGKALAFQSRGFVGPIRLTAKGKIRKTGQTPGSVTVVRSVMHPGSVMPARPYMRPALRESQEEIKELLRTGIAAALAQK